MTGVVGGFRWALLGQQAPGTMFWLSAAMSLRRLRRAVSTTSGAWNDVFADVV